MFKKSILIVLSSALTHCHPVIAEEYPTHVFPVRLTNIVDADTMDFEIDLGLSIRTDQRVRIKDFDAPETWRPKTEAERTHGEAATVRATELLSQKPLRLKIWGWGVYNRVEGNVILPDNRLLKDILIEEGFEKLGSYHD